MSVYQNCISLIEIFKAEMKIRPEQYGSTPCGHITVVVLCVCDSVVCQCRVSETAEGRMIRSSVNNSSGERLHLLPGAEESLSLCVQLYRCCAVPPGAINVLQIL